ncbi:MAG: hypothetical protein CMB83_01335 [Flammeovirgaceae bacterium]|nr:hypothetical protein [Flammeovirgaceae bacterium]
MINNLLIVIPSRLNAKRLNQKPLLRIGNKTLIELVYENVRKIKNYKILVATDSTKILHTCKKNKIPCIITNKKHKTGSDRVAEVSKKKRFKWILNLQGDEPLININDIRKLISKTLVYERERKNFVVSTLYVKKKFKENNKNEVKLLINSKNEVLLFSRKKILSNKKKNEFLKHIGIYLYKSKFLRIFSKLKMSISEKKK